MHPGAMPSQIINLKPRAAITRAPWGINDFNPVRPPACRHLRLLRFVMASLGDRESAENLRQDCFLRAYRARKQFRGAASPATWLMQIAINLVRKHETSSRLKFWRRALHTGLHPEDLGDWISDGQMTPEAAGRAKDQVRAIWSVVGQLSQRQRTVFLLRFVEDMDLLEI